MKDVSIIIVSFNSSNELRLCLDSIIASDIWEFVNTVFVVDNASKDSSIDVVRRYSCKEPKIQLIELKSNEGFASACNVGAYASSSDFLIFMNPDARLIGGFKDLLKFADQFVDVAACQPSILDDNGELESTGGAMDVLGHGYHEVSEPYKSHEIFYATFACVLVSRRIYLKLNGLNSSYFLVNEDLDFGWRSWLLGYKILHYSNAIAVHSGQKSTRKVPLLVQYHSRKNRLAMTFVNYSPLLAMFVVTLNIILFVGGSYRSWWKKDPSGPSSFVHAVIWFINNFFALTKQRRIIQSKRCKSDQYLFKRKFILLNMTGLKLYLKDHRKLDKLNDSRHSS
jgi:GT2 family glycosyltransferase